MKYPIDIQNVRESKRSWSEDYKLENGNYLNVCVSCGNPFMGYKRRIYCKTCSETKHKIKENE